MKLSPVGRARDALAIVAFAVAAFAPLRAAIAQSEVLEPRAEPDPHASPGPNVVVPLRTPSETEFFQPERASSGIGGPTLEQPLNPDKYICGRGDVFELNFWGAQNFKVRITVDTEGKAFLPKVGYVDIVGKTLSQARAIIKKAAGRFYPGLNFEMSLQQPRTFLVHVVGFVNRPGLYPATPVQRVSSLLATIGVASRGSRRRVQIKRRDGSVVVADLVRYEMSGDTALNPFLLDGDIVSVPFADVVVTVSGGVKRPGSVELIAAKDTPELLELAGGFRADMTRSLPIRVVHRDKDERSQESHYSFGKDGKVPEVVLHDGDQVAIPTVAELQRSILLIGPVAGATAADEVTDAKRLPFVEGSTVRSLVDGTVSTAASADLKNAYIKPEKGTSIPVDLEALLVRRDFSADRPVHMGDTIVIPQKRRGIAVEGAVYKPGIYPYNPNFTSSQYVQVAGGPSRMAKSGSVFQLVSPDGTARRIGLQTTVEPGDTIVLPERAFSRGEVVSLVMGGVGLLLSGIAVVVVIVK